MELTERDTEFRALFGAEKVLAYHFTRLLDAEVEQIRGVGLRALSEQLVRDRLALAVTVGALSEVDQARLAGRHVFALGQSEGRAGQVCAAMGRESLSDPGTHRLLSCWGGEAIYWSSYDSPMVPRLGRPSIVVVRIDVTRPRPDLMLFPDLSKLFVGRLLGTAQRFADVMLRGPIPAADVLAIWRPGDPEYNVLGLPLE